jgi:hypothetical protein
LPRDPRAYLHDILTAADAISGFLADADFDGYVENDLVRSAVERKFEIIGEALGQLAKVDANSRPEFRDGATSSRSAISSRTATRRSITPLSGERTRTRYRPSGPKLQLC